MRTTDVCAVPYLEDVEVEAAADVDDGDPVVARVGEDELGLRHYGNRRHHGRGDGLQRRLQHRVVGRHDLDGSGVAGGLVGVARIHICT